MTKRKKKKRETPEGETGNPYIDNLKRASKMAFEYANYIYPQPKKKKKPKKPRAGSR